MFNDMFFSNKGEKKYQLLAVISTRRGNCSITVLLPVTLTVYQTRRWIHCLPCRANPFPLMINFIVVMDIIIPLVRLGSGEHAGPGPVCNSAEVQLSESAHSVVIRFGGIRFSSLHPHKPIS